MRGFPLAICLAASVLAAPAAAQQRAPQGVPAMLVQGDYEGRGEGALSMRTLVLDDEKNIVAANVGVGAQGCGGNFTGIGELRGNTLRLRPYSKAPDNAACSITVTFDKSGKTAAMEESSCQYYHGAACGFSGKLVRQR